MDVIRFAFGDRPEIDDLDARRLTESLGAWGRNFPAVETIGKIDAELEKPPSDRADVTLNELQLKQLVKVLSEELPPDRPEIAHLLDEARAAYERREWAQDDS